jgi:peptidyl-prolyl cis-trans isomerase D
MLDKIRANSRSPITWVIFGAIIVVFIVAFGPGANGCAGLGSTGAVGTGGFAAKVNGTEIPAADFQRAYANFYRQYQQQMGANFSPEMANQLRLQDTVLDQLVERELLLEAARKQGLSVGDAEVAQAIQKITAFQKDGAFDFETYRAVVTGGIGVSTETFEADVREDLLVDKIQAQLRQAAKATDDEVRAEFDRDNDRANLSFVRFSIPQFQSDVAPTDAEVQAFLATDEGKKRVEEEFGKQAARFKQPKQVSARHILVKVAEGAPEAEVAAARAKIEDAKKQIEGGADFAEVAKQVSEDTSNKDKGGDLGFFGPGKMVKPFEDAAFAMKPGELSEPVRTRFGFHLIQVNEVKEASEKTLDEVRPVLAKEILAADRAKLAAKAAAEKALADARASGKTLAELFPKPEEVKDEHGHTAPAAPANRPVAEETGSFTVVSDYVPRLGIAGEVVRAAAGAKEGEYLPGVYEVGGTYVIARVAERTRPSDEEFAQRKDFYRERVLRRKQDAIQEGFVKKLRDEAKVETNPAIFADAGARG